MSNSDEEFTDEEIDSFIDDTQEEPIETTLKRYKVAIKEIERITTPPFGDTVDRDYELYYSEIWEVIKTLDDRMVMGETNG